MQPTSAWMIGTKEDVRWEQWVGWSRQVLNSRREGVGNKEKLEGRMNEYIHLDR